MRINFQSFNFKGYDAAPLKKVTFSEHFSKPFIEEFRAIADNEGFSVETGSLAPQWLQDYQCTVYDKTQGRKVQILSPENTK